MIFTSDDPTLTLNGLMLRSSFVVQINNIDDTDFSDKAISWGTGFYLLYKNELFFITADHVPHWFDHEMKERSGEVDGMCIHTNEVHLDQLVTKVITPKPIYSFNKGVPGDPNGKSKPVDVCICHMPQSHFMTKYVTQECNLPGESIAKGSDKIVLTEADCFMPSCDKDYFILGILSRGYQGIMIRQEIVAQPYLKYMETVGDYMLFNTREIIENDTNWSGLSGSAVFDIDGFCVGMLASVNIDTKAVWVIPIYVIYQLIDLLLSTKHVRSLPDNV